MQLEAFRKQKAEGKAKGKKADASSSTPEGSKSCLLEAVARSSPLQGPGSSNGSLTEGSHEASGPSQSLSHAQSKHAERDGPAPSMETDSAAVPQAGLSASQRSVEATAAPVPTSDAPVNKAAGQPLALRGSPNALRVSLPAPPPLPLPPGKFDFRAAPLPVPPPVLPPSVPSQHSPPVPDAQGRSQTAQHAAGNSPVQQLTHDASRKAAEAESTADAAGLPGPSQPAASRRERLGREPFGSIFGASEVLGRSAQPPEGLESAQQDSTLGTESPSTAAEGTANAKNLGTPNSSGDHTSSRAAAATSSAATPASVSDSHVIPMRTASAESDALPVSSSAGPHSIEGFVPLAEAAAAAAARRPVMRLPDTTSISEPPSSVQPNPAVLRPDMPEHGDSQSSLQGTASSQETAMKESSWSSARPKIGLASAYAALSDDYLSPPKPQSRADSTSTSSAGGKRPGSFIATSAGSHAKHNGDQDADLSRNSRDEEGSFTGLANGHHSSFGDLFGGGPTDQGIAQSSSSSSEKVKKPSWLEAIHAKESQGLSVAAPSTMHAQPQEIERPDRVANVASRPWLEGPGPPPPQRQPQRSAADDNSPVNAGGRLPNGAATAATSPIASVMGFQGPISGPMSGTSGTAVANERCSSSQILKFKQLNKARLSQAEEAEAFNPSLSAFFLKSLCRLPISEGIWISLSEGSRVCVQVCSAATAHR